MRVLVSLLLALPLASWFLPTGAGTPVWLLLVLVLGIAIWLFLSVSILYCDLWMLRLLRLFRQYVDENRLKRPRALIPVLLTGGWLVRLLGGHRETLKRIRIAITDYHYGWAEWDRTLDAAGRQARLAGSPLQKIAAYNRMLEAMAMLGRREAFALTFAAVEGTLQRLEEQLKPDGKEESEESRDLYKPLFWANYWRAVLAYRSADFGDARHWIARSEKLDDTQVSHLLLAAQMFALEGDEEAALKKIREARERTRGAQSSEDEVDEAVEKLVTALERYRPSSAESEFSSNNLTASVSKMFERARRNALWNVAWAEIKVAFWLGEPARIDKVLTDWRNCGDASDTGKTQVFMARMLAACLRQEGYQAEMPYAEVLGLARWKRIDPHTRGEIPLLRGVGQVYRGMPEAALEKFREIREGESWWHPPLVEALLDAYTAYCYEKMGRPSEGKPYHESARGRLGKGTRLRALKLARKAAG